MQHTLKQCIGKAIDAHNNGEPLNIATPSLIESMELYGLAHKHMLTPRSLLIITQRHLQTEEFREAIREAATTPEILKDATLKYCKGFKEPLSYHLTNFFEKHAHPNAEKLAEICIENQRFLKSLGICIFKPPPIGKKILSDNRIGKETISITYDSTYTPKQLLAKITKMIAI